MKTQTAAPVTSSRRVVRSRALVVIAAVAVVLSTVVGAGDAAAGKNQGGNTACRAIITTCQ